MPLVTSSILVPSSEFTHPFDFFDHSSLAVCFLGRTQEACVPGRLGKHEGCSMVRLPPKTCTCSGRFTSKTMCSSVTSYNWSPAQALQEVQVVVRQKAAIRRNGDRCSHAYGLVPASLFNGSVCCHSPAGQSKVPTCQKQPGQRS